MNAFQLFKENISTVTVLQLLRQLPEIVVQKEAARPVTEFLYNPCYVLDLYTNSQMSVRICSGSAHL